MFESCSSEAVDRIGARPTGPKMQNQINNRKIIQQITPAHSLFNRAASLHWCASRKLVL